ncbi:hypothetical protein L1049_000580 [Liquidambar formosana]|uniref:Uncharacterized protein n=1 Tax=Liquidambar formosana TaxID=63359 RepID=A0AAP0R7T9_LIQFO
MALITSESISQNSPIFDMQTFVVDDEPWQEGWVLFNRRQLLSITYIINMDGHLPLFGLVQQPEISPYLMPFPVLELLVCLETARTHAQREDKQSASESKSPSPSHTEPETSEETVEAVPLSYQLPTEITTTEKLLLTFPQMGEQMTPLENQDIRHPSSSSSKRFRGWTIEDVAQSLRMHQKLRRLAIPGLQDEVVREIKNIFHYSSPMLVENTIKRAIKSFGVEKVSHYRYSFSDIFIDQGGFSFKERLKLWTESRKQRPNNGRYDMYYRHELSHRRFRSIVEVVEFILFDICLEKKQKRKKRTSEDNSLPKGAKNKKKKVSSDTNSENEENLCYSTSSCKEAPSQTVGEFFGQAYNNLMNYHMQTTNQGLDRKEEACTGETQEQFLAGAHENLIRFMD